MCSDLQTVGASGITGWAITNLILGGYPTEDAFASVVGLTNRPLPLEAAQWPEPKKLTVVSGIDILNRTSQSALEAELKEKAKNISQVTHVYFFGKPSDLFEKPVQNSDGDSVYNGSRPSERDLHQRGPYLSGH